MQLDTSGNLGIGVTPSPANLPTIENAYGLFTGQQQMNIATNAYYNGGWKYQGTGYANRYYVDRAGGAHIWYNAPSGLVGNAITFTQAMTLDASGNLGIGATSAFAWTSNTYNGTAHLTLAGSGEQNITVNTTDTNLTRAKLFVASGGQTWGLWNDGAALKPFVVGGYTSEWMRIDSSGNVGIGTTSPTSALGIARGTGVNATIELAANNNTLGTTSMIVGQDGTNQAYCWNRANSILLFGTNNTERMRIDSSGNVNIGTYGVAYKLVVYGANPDIVSFHSGANATRGYVTSDNGAVYFGSTYGVSNIPTIFTQGGVGSGGVERMRIDTSGNIIAGSGEASATPVGNPVRAPNATGTNITGGNLSLYAGNGTGTGGSGYIDFQVAPVGSTGTTANTLASAMRILANGNVGIGTPSPGFKLDVNGAIRASSDNGIYLRNSANTFIGALITPLAWGVSSGSTTDISVGAINNLTFFTGGSTTERARIDSSGNLLVGTTSSPSGSGNLVVPQVYTGTSATAANVYVDSTGKFFRSTASASGMLVKISILTSGTSFTTQATTNSIYVECVGGGGGGGNGTSGSGSGAGGGAGAYAAKYFSVSPSTAYYYAIGLGGAAATAGGNTTFTVGATTVTAGGGSGGQSNGALGGLGGTATNGDLNTNGNPGNGAASASAGGTSVLGSGGRSSVSSTAATSGNNGGGGGGASSNAITGGSGGTGLIRIWEYT
jgi:hypothetical protein